MKKMSTKIMMAIILCSVGIILLLEIISTIESSKYIKNEINQKIVYMTESYADEFNRTFRETEVTVNNLASNFGAAFDIDKYERNSNYIYKYQNILEPIIKKAVKTSNGMGVYFRINPQLVSEENEIWYMKKGNKIVKIGKDIYEKQHTMNKELLDWYHKPILCGKGVWGQEIYKYPGAYEDLDSDAEVVYYSQPIIKDDLLIGVVGIEVRVDEINEKIKNIKTYSTGYAFLLNSDYDVLIHPIYEREKKEININDVEEICNFEYVNNNSGLGRYYYNGKEKIMSFDHLDNGWILCITQPVEEVFLPVEKYRDLLAILTFFAIVLIIVLARIFSNKLFSPFKNALNQVKLIESGEYNNEFSKELLNRNDEFGEFIKSVSSMQKVIRDLLGKVEDLNSGKRELEEFVDDFIIQTQIEEQKVNKAIKKVADNFIEEELEKEALKEEIKQDKIRIEYFSNISHEFKTPLNIILSGVQLILSYTQNNTDNLDISYINKYVNIIKQNSYRLLRLINNILDLTKLDTHNMKLKLINVNIVEVIESITLSTAEYVKSKSRVLIFDTETEEKILAVDPNHIERIILNLISNAIKFTCEEDVIEVFITEEDEDSICIHVKDSGIGIPENEQKLVFERFKQIDNNLNKNREGTGIGLALVKELVELHEGEISVKSKYNRGTEFIIKLPVRLVDDENISSGQYNYNMKVDKINIEFSDIYA